MKKIKVLLIGNKQEHYEIIHSALMSAKPQIFQVDRVSTYANGKAQLQEDTHDAYLIDSHLNETQELSNFIHEIATPLAVIRGRAEMLLESPCTPTKKNAHIIVSQIDRLSKFIQSFLNIVKEGENK